MCFNRYLAIPDEPVRLYPAEEHNPVWDRAPQAAGGPNPKETIWGIDCDELGPTPVPEATSAMADLDSHTGRIRWAC
jgi:hypothetical protein